MTLNRESSRLITTIRSVSASKTTKKCSVYRTVFIYFWNLRLGSLLSLITEGTKNDEDGDESKDKFEPQFVCKSDCKAAESLVCTLIYPLNISTLESNISYPLLYTSLDISPLWTLVSNKVKAQIIQLVHYSAVLPHVLHYSA